MAEAVVPEVFGQLALGHYLVLSAFLFAIGLAGFVTRRNMIVIPPQEHDRHSHAGT